MTKFKTTLISATAIAGVTASLVIRHQAQHTFLENDSQLRRQDKQLGELAEENRRLAGLVAEAKNSPADDRTAELVKLRSEAAAFRKRTNEPGKQLAENHPSGRPQSASQPEDYPEEYYVQRNRISDGKEKDAHTLSVVLVEYALEHQGEFPANLDQVTPYLLKRNMSLTGTNEFEIVYQGSLNELTNVPLRAVALVRERHPWLTPSGKWARVYSPVADGVANVVESDDNFQFYEAEHVIPPPSAGQ